MRQQARSLCLVLLATGAAGMLVGDEPADHWAFRPVVRPALPAVRDAGWSRSPVDRFVLAGLEANGLSPAPAAERRTLVRRLYQDLLGLPPSLEAVRAFERDERPDAWECLVDRLLASPQYGPRWGRHWLDVARYADTKDLVLVFAQDRVRPYAYTYRDYVIDAFNRDLPFDRFVEEQLAADKLCPPGSPGLAAMGFLTLGRLFDNNLPDIYDDQIDTVTRGFLGLTVSCARCHDHKYDAIPTRDYYSLYGVFANSEIPVELPRIGSGGEAGAVAEFEAQVAAKRAELERHIDEQYAALSAAARERAGDYLEAMTREPDPLEQAVFYLSLSPGDLRPQILARWRRFLAVRPADDPVFGPWRDLLALEQDAGGGVDGDGDGGEFALRAAARIARWCALPGGTARGKINPLVREALAGARLERRADVARLYGEVLHAAAAAVDGDPTTAAPQEAGTRGPARAQLADILRGRDGPVYFPRAHAYLYMDRVPRGTYHNLLQALDKLAVAAESAPPRARVLVDSPQIVEPRVFVRGNPRVPGEPVPRRFPRLFGERFAEPFPAASSGRLELARAITDARNPLTARVFVNRVWLHLFGRALVVTPNDFGVRGEPPSHPELLDYLAATLMESGWSVKRLHRLILTSGAYRQSSADRPAARRRDPENRWLWRANRRRLGLEASRDTLLAASGRLDLRLGGRPVDAANDPTCRRRTVYGLVDRQDVPSFYRAFDFASPDQSAGDRPQTTVPQQALFLLNSGFMVEQARALACDVELERAGAGARAAQRIAALHERVHARAPAPEELARGLRFLEEAAGDGPAGSDGLSALAQYAQVLLMTNELFFVD